MVHTVKATGESTSLFASSEWETRLAVEQPVLHHISPIKSEFGEVMIDRHPCDAPTTIGHDDLRPHPSFGTKTPQLPHLFPGQKLSFHNCLRKSLDFGTLFSHYLLRPFEFGVQQLLHAFAQDRIGAT